MFFIKMEGACSCFRSCGCPPLYIAATYVTASIIGGIMLYLVLINVYDFDESLPECQRFHLHHSIKRRAYALLIAIATTGVALVSLRAMSRARFPRTVEYRPRETCPVAR